MTAQYDVLAPDALEEQYDINVTHASELPEYTRDLTGLWNGEYAIADDDSTVLATDGFYTCVGIAGSAGETRFLSHTDASTVQDSDTSPRNPHVDAFTGVVPDDTAADLTYVVGRKPYRELLDGSRETVMDASMSLAEETVILTEPGQGVAIDETGALYQYGRQTVSKTASD